MEKEKLLEKLNGLDFKKCTTDDSYRALCEIGKEIDIYDFSGRFVRFKNLDNIVRTTLDEYGVRGVKTALDGITDLSHDFYYKDDDGKIRNVNENDLELWRYELKVCIEELWQELQKKRKHEKSDCWSTAFINDYTTNGDMIKAMFPHAKIRTDYYTYCVEVKLEYHSQYDTGLLFDKTWWNKKWKQGKSNE